MDPNYNGGSSERGMYYGSEGYNQNGAYPSSNCGLYPPHHQNGGYEGSYTPAGYPTTHHNHQSGLGTKLLSGAAAMYGAHNMKQHGYGDGYGHGHGQSGCGGGYGNNHGSFNHGKFGHGGYGHQGKNHGFGGGKWK